MTSEKFIAIIYTEGKTDWKHLKKAKEKLNIDLPIAFYESEESLGDEELLKMCQYLSKTQNDNRPRIFLFDRDKPKTVEKVKGEDKEYKDWGNNFFSFALPIPDHREGYDKNICIEFYYTNDEIRTKDVNGRRLFLSTEFKERSGRHKYYEHVVLGRKHQSKITEDDTKTKIIDSDVFDIAQNDINIALPKDDFAENVLNDTSPFNNFKFDAFRKIFNIIEEIIQNEIIPSMHLEKQEEELPPRFFIGREEQFEQFEKYLERNKPISVEGLGGIGKTEFAKKCIENFHLKEREVWFPCTRDSKLESLIETAGFSDLLKIEKLTELAKYSGFASLIECHEKVLFLDDFQEVTDPAFAKFFQFADKRLQKAKIILIAREHPEIGVLTSPIHLHGLEDDNAFLYAKQIVECNYPELKINDQDLKAICQQFKGHPLAIELAIYLLDFGISPEHLLQAVVEYEDEEFLARRLLDEIFNHPKSTPEEKECMLGFSVFRGKVKESALNYLFEGKNLVSIIRRLRRKLMLMYEDGFYGTHPLVREFCYDRLSDKKAWHKKAAEYFEAERAEKLDPVLEERVYYHLVGSEQWVEVAKWVGRYGESFINAGYINTLQLIMNEVMTKGKIWPPQFFIFYGDIARITCEWDKALDYYRQAFSHPNVDGRTMSTGIIGYGEVLWKKGEIEEALSYLEEGYKICQENNYIEGVIYSLELIGVIFCKKGNLDEAIETHRKCLKLREEIGNSEGIGASLGNLGEIFEMKGDLDNALQNYQKSLDIFEKFGYKAGIAAALNNIGRVLEMKGDLDNALQKHQESLSLRNERGDKLGIATSFNNIGQVLKGQGDWNSALEKYQQSLNLYQEIGHKSGTATVLNNIGVLLEEKGKLSDALEKHQQSLKLRMELDDKLGIANSYYNLSGVYFQQKNYFLSLQNLFIAQAIQSQVGAIDPSTEEFIVSIRIILGTQQFKTIAQKAFNQIPRKLQAYVNLQKFLANEEKILPFRRETPKVGRNDPCPCGSGKKYKKCCGR